MNLPAIISSGIAIISIIITITVIVLIFLRKIKQKTEENDKISIFWIIPFIILIVLSISLIGATIGINEMEDENMDNIVTEVKSIIDSARQRLNSVNLERYDDPLSIYDSEFFDKLEADCDYQLFRKNEYMDEMDKIEDRAKPFEDWIRTLNKTNTCAIKQGLYTLDLMIADWHSLGYEIYQFFISSVLPLYEKMDRPFSNDFADEEQKLLTRNYGKWKVENGVNLRKKILDNFEADMNNVQMIRRKWVEKMAEKLSAKKFIIKSCIIMSGSILILLSIISILFIVLGSKRIPLSSICKPTVLLIAGLCSIVASIVVILISLGIFEKCPLNEENFGLQDFITPIPGNESLSICQSRDLSFYSDLGYDTVVTFEDVETALEIPKHRDTYRSKILNIMFKPIFPQKYKDKLGSVKETVKKLTNACNSNCFPNDGGKLCNYANLNEEGKIITDKINSMIVGFNTFFESPEKEQIIDNVIDWHYATIFINMTTIHINPTQKEVVAADFSCDPLIEKFTQTGRSICDQLDGPISILHILLTIVAVSISAYSIVNVLIFKYSFNGKPKVKLDSGNKIKSQSLEVTPTNV